MKSRIFPFFLLAALPTGIARAQDPKPQSAAPRLEIKAAEKRDIPGYVTINVNGAISEILHARAKEIIEIVDPTTPIVGLEHLPRDRRFDVSRMLFAKEKDEVLNRLGETLGLTITRAETTADFLIVRNRNRPVPASWTPTNHAPAGAAVAGLKGIGEVDQADHLYNAYDVGMIDFVHFLNDYSTKPVWNQTSLTGTYSFSFQFGPKNVMQLLFDMGFDVFNAKRTVRCIVIAPRPEAK